MCACGDGGQPHRPRPLRGVPLVAAAAGVTLRDGHPHRKGGMCVVWKVRVFVGPWSTLCTPSFPTKTHTVGPGAAWHAGAFWPAHGPRHGPWPFPRADRSRLARDAELKDTPTQTDRCTVKLVEVLTWKTENFTLGVKGAKVFSRGELNFFTFRGDWAAQHGHAGGGGVALRTPQALRVCARGGQHSHTQHSESRGLSEVVARTRSRRRPPLLL